MVAALPWPLHAADDFPALTGHVVDTAALLPQNEQTDLERSLAAFEASSSDQVVVLTLPTLKGQEIEEYGYKLGRFWGIGQKGKDNGLILIVAAEEHKVRIEVGYGLEPLMTDAASNAIIRSVIVPDFRAGAMDKGIIDGVGAILAVIAPSADNPGTSMAPSSATAQSSGTLGSILPILFFILFALFAMRHPFLALMLGNSVFRSGSTGLGGWSGGGSSFSGGGGSFGGGGASGSW